MNQRLRFLYEEARRLTPDEQLDLARLLLDDEPPAGIADIDASWSAEATRRWKRHLRSGDKANDAFEAVDDIRERLARRRGE